MTTQPAVALAYAADFYRRYPGEQVAFFARVQINRSVTGFTVQLAIPAGITIEAHQVVQGQTGAIPLFVPGDGVTFLIWELDEGAAAGAVLEYKVVGVIDHHLSDISPNGFDRFDHTLHSKAEVTFVQGQAMPQQVEERIAIVVSNKGAYLNYLPALYQHDEFMGRFLMLFESFFSPVEDQLANLPFYFDPVFTPIDFLPWLASWFDLALDDSWSEQTRRKLVQSAIELYRKRGTKAGLEKYLQIFTGATPQIIEYSANNFVMGGQSRLGRGVALGANNYPHTFKVILHLPPVDEVSPTEKERLERIRRSMIEKIIDTEKPAHTTYTLEIETDN